MIKKQTTIYYGPEDYILNPTSLFGTSYIPGFAFQFEEYCKDLSKLYNYNENTFYKDVQSPKMNTYHKFNVLSFPAALKAYNISELNLDWVEKGLFLIRTMELDKVLFNSNKVITIAVPSLNCWVSKEKQNQVRSLLDYYLDSSNLINLYEY